MAVFNFSLKRFLEDEDCGIDREKVKKIKKLDNMINDLRQELMESNIRASNYTISCLIEGISPNEMVRIMKACKRKNQDAAFNPREEEKKRKHEASTSQTVEPQEEKKKEEAKKEEGEKTAKTSKPASSAHPPPAPYLYPQHYLYNSYHHQFVPQMMGTPWFQQQFPVTIAIKHPAPIAIKHSAAVATQHPATIAIKHPAAVATQHPATIHIIRIE